AGAPPRADTAGDPAESDAGDRDRAAGRDQTGDSADPGESETGESDRAARPDQTGDSADPGETGESDRAARRDQTRAAAGDPDESDRGGARDQTDAATSPADTGESERAAGPDQTEAATGDPTGDSERAARRDQTRAATGEPDESDGGGVRDQVGTDVGEQVGTDRGRGDRRVGGGGAAARPGRHGRGRRRRGRGGGRGRGRGGGIVGAAVAPRAPWVWPRILAVIAVVAVGMGAAWVTRHDAENEARVREELVAQQTAGLAATTVQELLAATSGVSGLPDADGHVRRSSFNAYVEGALAASPLESLAFAPVVTDAERASLERAMGRPIRDSAEGPPAPRRDTYIPVRWVTPQRALTDRIVGLDLATDPVRTQAIERARDTGQAVLSGTVPSQPTGRPAVFLVHAVYRPGLPAGATVAERRRAVVGYVTTGVLGDRIRSSLARQIQEPLGIRITDLNAADAGPLLETRPAPGHGVTLEREVAGRTWRITVDDRQTVSTAAPAWILIGTGLLALTLVGLAVRARRHHRDVARHVVMVERTAGLGRTLAAADSVADIARVVAADLPAVLKAKAATLALVDHTTATIRPPRAPGARAAPSSAIDAVATTRLGSDRGTAADPPALAVRDRAPVVILDEDGWEAQAPPAMAATAAAAGLGATAWWPVTNANGTVVATIAVAWGRPGKVDDLTLASLGTAAELCGQTLGRARMADLVRRDAVTNRLLAGLAEAAATAGTVEQVARTLVDRAADVPGARSAHIGLVNAERTALDVIHHDSVAPVIAGRHSRQELDHPRPLVEAYKTQGPVLLPDLAAIRARFPGYADDIEAAGLRALACLPLVDDAGTRLGALALAWSGDQEFDDPLVDTLRTTADLCASSIGRARTTDLAQAGTSALASLAGRLAGARSFDDVGTAIVEAAPAALGADFAIVGVIDDDQLRVLSPSGPALDVLAPYADLDLDEDIPVLVALRRRETVTFTDLGAVLEPGLAADLAAMGLHAGAWAPLLAADGEPMGALSVLWSAAPDFDEALVTRITTVADLSGQSAERARLFDAEHRVSRDIQARVLPRIPQVALLDVAARYQPAAPSVGMGGDWYDGIALDGGRLCLVLGDVTGHGVEAIAEMTQIRTVVHTLAAGGMPLPEILARTSSSLQREGGGYATLVLAVIDPAAGTVSYVTAGHPPPMVRRPGGEVDMLRDGHHSVLGVDLAPRPEGRADFPPGSTLVAYTDGLIERRDTTIDVAISRLAARLSAAEEPTADALADALLAANAPASRPDDVALVVARRPADGDGTEAGR
ncbi:MAG TPA: SpoIIE family protein phosphatase, partial [Acidimicrobiales bacterium]|nr:SpoIIE family protein phosphatase [Acidimicrobiales bacterium]